MSDGQIKVDYIVNASEFNKNVAQMKRNMQLCTQEVKNSAKEVNLYGSNIQTLTAKQQAIKTAISQSEKIIAQYSQNIDKNKTALASNRTELEKLAAKKKETTAAYKQAVKVYGEESDEAKKLKQSLDQVSSEYDTMKDKVKNNEKNITSYTNQMQKQKGTLIDLQTQLKNTNEELEKQANKFIKASETFAAFGDGLEKAGGKLKNLGTEVQQAGLIIVTAAAGLANLSAGFETGLAKVNTLVMDSKEGLANYGEAVMNLSNDTGVGVTDLTDALYDAISAGVDYADSTQFINDVNKVAVGGFTDISSASNLMTQIMNIYGKSVEDVGDVSDKLFLVQKNGVTTVGQLASSMGEAMTMGASYNVSLENVLSSYASLTKQGRTASTAQTQIKAALQELGDTGSNVGQILQEKTGKSFTALMSEGNSLYDVLKIVKDSCNGNEDAFNNLWSSTEAGLASMSLLANEGEFFNSTMNDMANSAGLTDEAFNIMAETSEFKFKKSLNEAKNSLIELGDSLLPFMDEVSKGISDVAKYLSKLNPETVKSIAKFGALAVVFGTTMKVTGSLVTVLGKGAKGISGLLKVAADTKSLGSFSKALRESEGSVGSLVKGLGGLSATGGAIGLAIAGIAALGVALYSNEKEISDSEEKLKGLGDSYDDFTGRLRTNSSIWSSIFGTEYNIKFSDKYKESMAGVTDDVEQWTSDLKAMQEEINRILNDTTIADDTKQEQISNLIQQQMSSLTNDLNAAKEEFTNGLAQAAYEDYLKAQGYSDEVVQEYSGKYQNWYQNNLDHLEKYTNDIQQSIQESLANDGQITEEELENINTMYEKAATDKAELFSTSEADITSTIQEESLKRNAIMDDGNNQSLRKQKEYFDEAKQSEADYWNQRYEEIKNDTSLSEEAKNSEKANIQERLNNLNMLTEYQKTSCEARALYDQEYAAANKLSVQQIQDDALGTVTTISDCWGNIQSTYLENQDALSSWAEQNGYTLKEIEGQNGEMVTVAVNAKNEIVGSVQSTSDAYSLFASDINGYMSEYQSYVDSGQMTTEEAMERIQTDLDSGKISAQQFGFSTKQQFLDVAKQALSCKGDVSKLKPELQGIDKTWKAKIETTGIDTAKSGVDGLLTKLGGLVNKAWTAVVNVVTGKDETKGKALGGTVNNGEIFNVNEQGPELFDSASATAYSLDAVGESAYLPMNTRVSNALLTTQKMQGMVNKEVSIKMVELDSRINKLVSALEKYGIKSGGDFKVTMNNPHFENKGSENANINNVKRIIGSIK